MGYIKQTGFVYQSAKANAEHDFSLFYLDHRRQAAFAVAFCINKPFYIDHDGFSKMQLSKRPNFNNLRTYRTERYDWHFFFF